MIKVEFSCVVTAFFVLHSELAVAFLQIFLGEGIKESEEQVIQVAVTCKFGKIVQPVAILRPGTLEHVSVDISFSDQLVTFSLVKVSGPVHVIGNHTYGNLTLKSASSQLVT